MEKPLSLNEQRLLAVAKTLHQAGSSRVLDLGCGNGQLIAVLLRDQAIDEVVGLDVSALALDRARQRLNVDRLAPRQASRLKLLQGSLTYRDRRLEGFDAAAIVEVIEHMDAPRLPAFEAALFEYAKPKCIVMTTPNADYNVRFLDLAAGAMRHPDHRFEWTRVQFEAWCNAVAGHQNYNVRFEPIGPVDAEVGPPTQMAVFSS